MRRIRIINQTRQNRGDEVGSEEYRDKYEGQKRIRKVLGMSIIFRRNRESIRLWFWKVILPPSQINIYRLV